MKRSILAALLLLAGPVSASSKTPGVVISGWVEKITLLPWNIQVKAKMDTGANTGSIHADKIRKFQRDGQRWVAYQLVLDTVDGKKKRIDMESRRVRRVRVKDHETDNDSRVVVELDFCMDGRKRRADFTLADRGKFNYPILLGRRFLQGIAIVDPASTFLTQAACDSGIKAGS